MWIVRLALRRPLTVAVMVVLMALLGVVSLQRMNYDIFPAINLPVVVAVWNYPGLNAEDMERRVVFISERGYTTTVNGIEHIESESLNGIGLIRIYFHPGSEIGASIAQISSMSEGLLHNFPPGMSAPSVVDYDAANVPVAQLTLSSDTLSEQRLWDFGLNFIRPRLFTIEGISAPAPMGGRSRQVMVNIHPAELYAKGLSAQDVVDSLQASNVIIPAGTAKIGNTEYFVLLNGSPPSVDDFNRLPVKVTNGTPVFLGDVAAVSDSHSVQNNVVRVNGRRASYISILKHASASTLEVIKQVKARIPIIREIAPPGYNISMTFDQSLFVRGALYGVAREAVLAAGLVALMILLFLGSWRSTVIVIVSI